MTLKPKKKKRKDQNYPKTLKKKNDWNNQKA